MSENFDELGELGDKIKKIIDTAVSTKDYRQMTEDIKQTVGQTVNSAVNSAVDSGSEAINILLKTFQFTQFFNAACEKSHSCQSSDCHKTGSTGHKGTHMPHRSKDAEDQSSQSHSTGKDST